MILLPSVLRPFRFPCGLPLAALAVTTAVLAVATGALAQERYRTPDEAVAALVDAVRSDALPPPEMFCVAWALLLSFTGAQVGTVPYGETP